jgi:hypothetical protein
MWRIVFINDGYAIMNLLTEETIGSFDTRAEAKQEFEYMERNGDL